MAAPGTFADWATTPMLVLDRKDRLQHRFLAARTGRDLDPPIHYVPAVASFVAAIRLGLGWGMVPEHQLTPADTAGGLIDIAPGKFLDVPLYWQYWRLESAALTALTAAVRAAMASRAAASSGLAGGRKRLYCWEMMVALFFSCSKEARRIWMRPSCRTASRISARSRR
jgi:DNA-binding transcriptional LysR family regulator